MNVKKITVFSSLALACVVGLCACAPKEEEPPVIKAPQYGVDEALMATNGGNDDLFAPAAITADADSPLKGKVIYWLGSSVTYGAASMQASMADFLAAKTGCISKKEAVSGTTIFDNGGTGDTGSRSYTRRMMNSTIFDKTEKIDAFICQISTNDATNTRLKYRGEMTEADCTEQAAFKRDTTLGGVEYIISYVHETWNCPIYFYSGSYFGDEGARKNTNPKGSEYGKLVGQVKEIAEKWNALGYPVEVIDMYNDTEFNAAVSDAYYVWCMQDAIHPKRAGYLQWWTPYFEFFLSERLG